MKIRSCYFLVQRLGGMMSIALLLLFLQSMLLGQDVQRQMGPPERAAAARISAKCPSVEILGSHDTDQVSWRFDGGIAAQGARLEDPKSEQVDTLIKALDLLSPILCKSVVKVAFVYRPPEKKKAVVNAWTTQNDRQNLLYLNTHRLSNWNEENLKNSAEARYLAIQNAIHETTHAAIRLIQSLQKAKPYRLGQLRPDADLWLPATQQMARAIIASNRLEGGVIREWQRIHDAFVAVGMADKYYGDGWTAMEGYSGEYLAKAGLMTAYGGKEANEDIAEMVSWVIVRGTPGSSKDAACRIMRNRTDSRIKSDDAAVFTKLGFIRTLGFISDDQYKSCVGRLKIDAPGPGFHSYDGNSLSKSYTGDPQAGIGGLDLSPVEDVMPGKAYAVITADGTVTTTSGNVPITIKLTLALRSVPIEGTSFISYPRGVYQVGSRNKTQNQLQFLRKDDGKVILDVTQASVLVARASDESIVGSVFIQRITNYSGGMLSAIAGDEPATRANRLTFLYRPGNR